MSPPAALANPAAVGCQPCAAAPSSASLGTSHLPEQKPLRYNPQQFPPIAQQRAPST